MVGELLAFAVFFIFIIFVIQKKRNKNKRLPPGPIQWPIIGSLPQMMWIDPLYTHLQFFGLAKKYGGIFSFGFGVQYAVVVSNYEILKDLFRRPESNLERFQVDFLKPRSNFKNLGIIYGRGDVWKEQRKITIHLLKQYGFGKKYSMEETIQQEITDLIHDIKNEINSSGGIWKVDYNRLSACQVNILWASVGGYRFDPHSAKFKRQLELNAEVFKSLGDSNLLGVFPFLKIFPVLSGYKKICEIQMEVRDFIMELIHDARDRRQGRVEAESFLEAYLDEVERKKSTQNTNTTVEQLALIVMDLFLAGSDSTSAAICWMILYLGLYEDVQTKARAEIKGFIETDGFPISPGGLTRMPYIHAVILETFRHAAFGPAAIPRRVTEDTDCGGYRIPKGTCLFGDFYTIFHDQSFWGDPEVFRPERLLLANGSLDPNKVERVLQFGIGARVCPGENMAFTSAFLTLIHLLKTFSFQIIKGREPSLEPSKPSLVMQPKPFSLKVKILDN